MISNPTHPMIFKYYFDIGNFPKEKEKTPKEEKDDMNYTLYLYICIVFIQIWK